MEYDEAYSQAQAALEGLRSPHVNRMAPSEGSALLNLTVLLEQLATEVGKPGAAVADLQDALRFAHAVSKTPSAPAVAREWIATLESRIGDRPDAGSNEPVT